MDHAEARRILGVGPEATEDEIRAAHRVRIRRAHPDAGGEVADAARLNQAIDVLRDAPPDARADGAPPPPPHPPTPATPRPPEDDADRLFVVADQPASLLARLAEASHEIGELVYVDRHVGMLEIVVGVPPAVGQLAVTVGDEGPDGTPVSFTLEPLGVTPAPPINDVVDELMRALQS